MEVNDANLDALANHLQKTLASDVNVRKPGKSNEVLDFGSLQALWEGKK